MKKSLLLIFTLSCFGALAGQGSGNGGDVVVCDDGSARLLDHMEGETRGLVYNLGTSKQNYRAHLEEAAQRLKVFSKQFAERIENKVNLMADDIDAYRADMAANPEVMKERVSVYKNITFTTDELVDIEDSEHLTFPRGCEVKQIAIQVTPQYEGERRYTIDKLLFNKLDEAGIAGLVLHEVIYQYYFEQDWSKNSIEARSLNTMLSSGVFEGLTLPEFLNKLHKVKFDWIPITDFNVKTQLEERRLTRKISEHRARAFYFGPEWQFVGPLKEIVEAPLDHGAMPYAPLTIRINSQKDFKSRPITHVSARLKAYYSMELFLEYGQSGVVLSSLSDLSEVGAHLFLGIFNTQMLGVFNIHDDYPGSSDYADSNWVGNCQMKINKEVRKQGWFGKVEVFSFSLTNHFEETRFEASADKYGRVTPVDMNAIKNAVIDADLGFCERKQDPDYINSAN